MSVKIRIGIDQGGTFTDCVAVCSHSIENISFNCKLLTQSNLKDYSAPTLGVRRLIEKIRAHYSNPILKIESIRLGTTITTNALLQDRGKSVGVIITSGFEDLFWIGDQSRRDIFDLSGENPQPSYSMIAGIEERIILKNSKIHIESKPQKTQVQSILKQFKEKGVSSIAICLIHGWRFTEHEQMIANWCQEEGFQDVFCSHNISTLPNFLYRSYLTVIDAGLSPLISNIQKHFIHNLNDLDVDEYLFMKSDAGLCKLKNFRGFNSLLSGPCGGVTALSKFFKDYSPLIGFDMGGTSSDVTRFDEEVEISLEHTVNGLPIYTPQVNIETVASGGGSILSIEDGLLKVGPESSGSFPGPLCYGFDGRLSLTDANLVLGRLQAELIEPCFGYDRKNQLNISLSRTGFNHLLALHPELGFNSVEELAEAFLLIANQQMSQPILEVSAAKGYELQNHHLVCFGGAAGQHACLIAKDLGIEKVLIHSQAGLLSAAGLLAACPEDFEYHYIGQTVESVQIPQDILKSDKVSVLCRYANTNTIIKIKLHPLENLKSRFEEAFYNQFGFNHLDVKIIVEHAVIHYSKNESSPELSRTRTETKSKHTQKMRMLDVYTDGINQPVPCYAWEDFPKVVGPAIIYNQFTSIFVESGFESDWDLSDILILKRKTNIQSNSTLNSALKVTLFAGRVQSIARQMGQILRKTAISINIRERLDFSCAIFSNSGELICNAPHIPVHLGSMSSAILSMLSNVNLQRFKEACLSNSAQAILSNSPNSGGTHLPDLTLISPIIFNSKIVGWLASRGHHADIGGISPGSMSAKAKNISEEGLCLESFWIVKDGQFLHDPFYEELQKAKARFPLQNLADVKAQWNANLKGQSLIQEYLEECGLHNWNNSIQTLLQTSHNISKSLLYPLVVKPLESNETLDDGSELKLKIVREAESVVFDFSECSKEVDGPFNAPRAISYSAVIYCLRCMIKRSIPLNDGLMRSVKLKFSEGSILSPSKQAAVSAGNVTTSQRIVDLIFKAFQWCAASQGCMNNVIFGNDTVSFYETIAGGNGATPDSHGAHGKHSHMTNTRITDVEIMEREYPVILRRFALRPNSGGDGLFKGGNGIIRHLEFIEDLSLSLLTERRSNEPYGMNGGQNAYRGENILIRDGQTQILKSRVELNVQKGDQFIIKTPGGGGYGTT